MLVNVECLVKLTILLCLQGFFLIFKKGFPVNSYILTTQKIKL